LCRLKIYLNLNNKYTYILRGGERQSVMTFTCDHTNKHRKRERDEEKCEGIVLFIPGTQ
jgi:hypothetical protein